MASGVTTQHLASILKVSSTKHLPAATTAQVLTPDGTTKKWYDMTGYEWIAFAYLTYTSGSTSGPTLLEIVCADDTTGTNTTVVVSHTVVSAANSANGSQAAGDTMSVECEATQIREVVAAAGRAGLGTSGRYCSLRVTNSNSGDTGTCTVIQAQPKAPQNNLTVDVVA